MHQYFTIFTKNGRQYWSTNEAFNALSESDKQSVYQQFKRFDKTLNPNSADQVFRKIQLGDKYSITHDKANDVKEALNRGFSFYDDLQTPDGNWAGDYGGPMFLLPGLVIASHVTESPFEAWQQELMKTYILNHQNEDGGWGLHIEGKSTMFGTVMNYVALRMLGLEAELDYMKLASKWIKDKGGATLTPAWGKFYLSVLGVYEWDGCTSLFPETWLLPKFLPIHPSKFWCHTRMVYLPMAYCYGHRMKAKNSDLINNIKQEIYNTEYHSIKWRNCRTSIAESDRYFPMSSVAKGFNAIADTYEKVKVKSWRKKSLDFIRDYVDAEDEQTNYINIGPVNQVINSLVVFHAYGKDSEQFQKHRNRWKDYLWLAEDGLKMQGYNGSQLWDTAFYVHALTESKDLKDESSLKRAYNYLDYTQIKEEVRDRKRWFRHESVGGWPFSTLAHGWPISDCTALGLSAVIRSHTNPNIQQSIEQGRLEQAVDIILSYQNTDGSWSTYEQQRASGYLELLNPSEIFGEIMVDYPHVECSSSCIQALIDFQEQNDSYRDEAINEAIETGITYLLTQQESNGGWYGNWGVCYTYGTWFTLEALNRYKGGNAELKDAIEKACAFLVKSEHVNGGWGESFESCVKQEYVQHNSPQIVNTAWAVLGLLASGKRELPAVDKGIKYLLSMQEPSGDFPQQGISGVFNHNCMITYTAYRNVFPLWALARYERMS